MFATMSEMLRLHDGLLGQLYAVIPNAELNQRLAKEPPIFRLKTHVRWHSADSMTNRLMDSRLGRRLRHSLDIAVHPRDYPLGSVADSSTTTAVAKIFTNTVDCPRQWR